MISFVSKYSPYCQQSRFHSIIKKYKLFLAGLGAGKTLTGAHEAAFLMQDNPDSDGFIGVPTYPMFRNVIMPIFEDWFPRDLWSFNSQYNQFTWKPTGRKIFIGTATAADRARGPNVAWSWFDELAMVLNPKFYDIVCARVRDPKANRRQIYATTTPRGYNWLIKKFRAYASHAAIIRARTADNHYLPADYEPGLRAQYGDEFAAQELDAKILEMSGLVWPIYQRLHIRPLDWILPRITNGFEGGIDWGFTNPAGLIVIGYDVDGRAYLVDEWKDRGKERDKIADQALVLQKKWKIRRWYADHDPEGVGHIMKRGMTVSLAEKKVIDGIQYVRSQIHPRGDGEPRIYISETCQQWLKEQSGYQFPPGDLNEELPEEPVAALGDHLLDASRYALYTKAIQSGTLEYKGASRHDDDENTEFSF